MLSGRELALEQNPQATGWVNQRIVYTHGIGVAMVPVNEAGSQGQPNLFIGNLPPTSTAGAPTITQPRIYFGERPSSYVVTGAQEDEFDYPTGETDTGGSVGAQTRWTGTTGVKLNTTLMRLLFAARFRDLDLLISNQVTARQPAPVPSLPERPADPHRAVPALRQGPLPRHRRVGQSRLHPGRVHDLRPVPRRPAVRSGLAGLDQPRHRRVQLHPQQRQDHGQRLRRHDALLRRGSGRPDHPRLPGHLPDAVRADRLDAVRPARPHPGARGAVQRPDPGLRPLSRDRSAPVLPAG